MYVIIRQFGGWNCKKYCNVSFTPLSKVWLQLYQLLWNSVLRNFSREFLRFTDRASQHNLRQWPTWYTLALFYNRFITILYMFRALYAHLQEVELYLCGIWYRHSQSVAVRCTDWERTISLAVWERTSSLSTCAPDGHWLRVTITDAASIQFSLLMMSI